MSLEPSAAIVRRRGRLFLAIVSPLGIASAVGLTALLALAILAPVLWGARAGEADLTALSQGPSGSHPFGTDAGGRDVLARVLVATQLSVTMALTATAIGSVLGVILGCLPVIVGRRTGRLITAAVNLAVAFPALLLTIFLSIVVGQGVVGAVLAVGLAMAPTFARLTQTMSASIAGRDFVAAARILGVSRWRILMRHILPNIREPLIVNASISAGSGLITFAGLSFLGLGVQPPEFDWGRLLNEGLSKIYVNPVTALAPAIAVVASGIVFSVFGEALAKGLGVESRTVRLPRMRRQAAEGADPVPDRDGVAGPVLSVRNLTVGVPRAEGWAYPVREVSFDVGRGEIVGLVGESGSGKSLTCMAVAGLIEEPLSVTADRISFDGVELTNRGAVESRTVSRRHGRHLGTRLAMVFQDPMSSLNPALKVGTQVAEIGALHEGMSWRRAREVALERLRQVRISEPERRMHQYPHELSGGMRQRAMIATGLMGTPSLLIADEPTTALDVTVQRGVLGLLRAVRDEHGSAILLISHDIAVITGLCTRVLVMYRGRIVEEVSSADLAAGRARHPYTQALLRAVPSMRGERGAALVTIPEDASFDSDSASDPVETTS